MLLISLIASPQGLMGPLNMCNHDDEVSYHCRLSLPSSSSLTVLASLSASSFSFFSSSLECFSSALAPAPILFFPVSGPSAQKPSVGEKMEVGSPVIAYSPTGAVNCAAGASTACSKYWRMFEHFPVLGEDFGHPLPT